MWTHYIWTTFIVSAKKMLTKKGKISIIQTLTQQHKHPTYLINHFSQLHAQ